MRVPVPQLALEEGFERLQPVGHLEVTLLLRDGQQPKEVNVPVAYALPVKPDETSGCLIYPCGLL